MNVMHKFGIFGACFEPILVLIRSTKGDIHKLRRQARGKGEGRGGFAKCQCYYISLCSKLASGGEGGQNWQNLAYVVYGWPHSKNAFRDYETYYERTREKLLLSQPLF